MTILGGLSHPRSRELMGHIAGDTWLTAGDLRTTYNNNISIDQVAAGHLGKKLVTRVLFSVRMVALATRVVHRLCPTMPRACPLPSEHKHRQIFERYFSPDGMGSTAERKKKIQQGKRMVDLIMGSSKDLKRNLGKNDQVKIDEYLHSLDSVEGQLERNEAWLGTPLKKVNNSHLNFDLDPAKNAETYVRSMYDLMVLGYQMDLTRVMTFMIAREDGMGFGENYPKLVLGAAKGHHSISHAGDPKLWSHYDEWLSKQFAYFLDQMKSVKDEHGSILDNTQVLYGSACSTTHNAINLPLILAGGKNMGLNHGTFTKYTDKTPMSNLFVSMLNAAGIQRSRFSDSTGTLPGEIFT